MMAEPIRALELHYPMIQFLIIIIIAMLFLFIFFFFLLLFSIIIVAISQLDAFCAHAHRLNQQTDEMHAPWHISIAEKPFSS